MKIWTIRHEGIAYLVMAETHSMATAAVKGDSRSGFLLGRASDSPEFKIDDYIAWQYPDCELVRSVPEF